MTDRFGKESQKKLLMENRGEISEKQLKKSWKRYLSRARREAVNEDTKQTVKEESHWVHRH